MWQNSKNKNVGEKKSKTHCKKNNTIFFDRTQKLNMWRKKVQKPKWWKKTKNSYNCEKKKLKNQIVTKLKNSNGHSSYGDGSDGSTNSDNF